MSKYGIVETVSHERVTERTFDTVLEAMAYKNNYLDTATMIVEIGDVELHDSITRQFLTE